MSSLRVSEVPGKIELDSECFNCNCPWDKPDTHCHCCHGTGYALTADGEALLKFLKRHWKP